MWLFKLFVFYSVSTDLNEKNEKLEDLKITGMDQLSRGSFAKGTVLPLNQW